MVVSYVNDKQKVDKVDLGQNVKLGDFINLYGCKIGDRTKIGTFVEIQKDVEIGVDCKIQSHTFICEGVQIGDGVFAGHNVSFINDRHPRAVNDYGNMISGTDEWTLERIHIGNRVSIGTSATIMCGCVIGNDAVIGAGAVVIDNVPDGVTVVGNPARIISK